jgi:pimeloyl-ACP methyl ester carboxylesterase
MPQTACRTGVTLNYEISGEGDPLLLVMGTSGAIGLWGELVPRLSQRHRVIAFDNRGLGGSERGEGAISVASMAEDASALLEALDVPRAHVMGWSLGSAVAQELALAHPEQVASAIMYATWGRCDGFQRSVITALRLPYAVRDMEAALTAAGIAFSPQILDDPTSSR